MCLTTSQTFPLRAISQPTDPTVIPEKLTQFPQTAFLGYLISNVAQGDNLRRALRQNVTSRPATYVSSCSSQTNILVHTQQHHWKEASTERGMYQPNRAEITSAPPAGPVDWAVQRDTWWKEEKQTAVYPSVYTSSVPCFCYLKLGPECICLTAVWAFSSFVLFVSFNWGANPEHNLVFHGADHVRQPVWMVEGLNGTFVTELMPQWK